jgi:hypothetical protein
MVVSGIFRLFRFSQDPPAAAWPNAVAPNKLRAMLKPATVQNKTRAFIMIPFAKMRRVKPAHYLFRPKLVMQPQRKLQNPRPIGLACDNSKGHRGIHIGRRSRKLSPVEQVERFHTELHASACSNAHQVYWKTTLRYNLKP